MSVSQEEVRILDDQSNSPPNFKLLGGLLLMALRNASPVTAPERIVTLFNAEHPEKASSPSVFTFAGMTIVYCF